ncbi:MAG: hypothetical protein L0Z53_17245 [Acidobacteriales bacterium]|nr:hypothetical protein [Terriglobales bacterium]
MTPFHFGPVELLLVFDVALIALLFLRRTMKKFHRIMLMVFIVPSLVFAIIHKIGNEIGHASDAYWQVRQVENLLLPLTVLSFALLVLIVLYEIVHWVRMKVSN